jgi:hypothetical protein
MVPEKGRDFDLVNRAFERYRREHDQPQARLFRTERIIPWECWNWGDYLVHPRWRLPYREPAEATPAEAAR